MKSFLLLLLLAACGGDGDLLAGGPPGPAPGEPDGVLFIGNSLTAGNDLPGMVADLSAAAGRPLRTGALVEGGFSLEDHWRLGAAPREIARGGWAVVVLQQGPSTLPESRAHLLRWADVFARAVRAAGARPAVLMAWPPASGDWDRGIESYRLAAEGTGALLFPVAEAFLRVREGHPEVALLAGDDFHPSALGSYLAALVIVARLHDRSPVGLPARLEGRVSVEPEVARVLQEAAAEAIAGGG